jgi:hypothetical protein
MATPCHLATHLDTGIHVVVVPGYRKRLRSVVRGRRGTRGK